MGASITLKEFQVSSTVELRPLCIYSKSFIILYEVQVDFRSEFRFEIGARVPLYLIGKQHTQFSTLSVADVLLLT